MKEKYVPRDEIYARIRRLQSRLAQEHVEGALVWYKVDYLYFSGQAQNSALYVPVEGEPLLMVARDVDRAREESPLKHIVPLESPGELPALITSHYGTLPRRVGMELDVLPVRDYFKLQELLGGAEIVDSSKIIKQLRMIKGPFEIAQMRKAGEIARAVYEEGCAILREGMSEIEFGGHLELVAKRLEHEGLIRVRSLNYEAYSWHVLSGPSGSMVSQADSPMGGAGLSPAFPVGAGTRKIRSHEPVLVDFGVCYNGYVVDSTRIYSIGELPEKYLQAYAASRKIEELVVCEARPGAECAKVYEHALDLAANLGYEEYYLGVPGKKTTFVAHGIGLEISEIPIVAAGQPFLIEADTTIAIEPKMVFAQEGAVGIENTVFIGAEGTEKLTLADEHIYTL